MKKRIMKSCYKKREDEGVSWKVCVRLTVIFIFSSPLIRADLWKPACGRRTDIITATFPSDELIIEQLIKEEREQSERKDHLRLENLWHSCMKTNFPHLAALCKVCVCVCVLRGGGSGQHELLLRLLHNRANCALWPVTWFEYTQPYSHKGTNHRGIHQREEHVQYYG